MSRRASARVALLAAVAALLTSLLVALPGPTATAVAPPATAAAADPQEDQPRLPARCNPSGENVPVKAGPCYLTKFRKHRPTVVMWGDSHAWQHIPAARPLARKKRVNLVMFMLGGCPPILVGPHYKKKLYSCEKSNQMALQFVRRLKEDRRQPVRVLLGAFWEGYRSVYEGLYVTGTIDKSDFDRTKRRSARTFHRSTPRLFAKLAELRVRVDAIGQAATVAATVPAGPPRCGFLGGGQHPYECNNLPRTQALPRENYWNRWFRKVLRPLPGNSHVIKFNRRYCNATVCKEKVGGIYTFFDYTHISATRAGTFKRYFRSTFRGLG